jgi:hypothetical protein
VEIQAIEANLYRKKGKKKKKKRGRGRKADVSTPKWLEKKKITDHQLQLSIFQLIL